MIRKHLHAMLMAITCCVWLTAQSTGRAADPAAKAETDSSADVFFQPAGSYEELVARGQNGSSPDLVARFGWWGISTQGDIEQVGEWDSLESSPFWDVDTIRSDGQRTLDLSLSGTEQEANAARGYWFSPGLTITLDYDRFLHRVDNEPLDNVSLLLPTSDVPGRYREAARWTPLPDGTFSKATTPGLARQIIGQDLNAGEDFAIRVQELNVGFKGNITENLKWRLNLWGIRKEGERQVFGTGHCFNGTEAAPGHPTTPPVASGSRACHVLTRAQRIDWTTIQIEPMLIGTFGPATVTYSHKTRALDQNDELLLRNYTTNSAARTIGSTSGAVPNFWDYAYVPENVTDIDRLRIGWDLNENNRAYANLFVGNTHNRYRGTDRQYSGWDLRLSNQTFENLDLTGYFQQYQEQNDGIPPPRAVPAAVQAANSVVLTTDEIAPADPTVRTTDWRVERWDYDRRSVGVDGQWRPFGGGGDLPGLSITAGYDHTDFLRRNAVVPTEHFDVAPFSGEPVEIGSTSYDTISFGFPMRWNQRLDSFVRYKRIWIRNPLFAVHWPNEEENTSLPTDVDLVEFGGTWFPGENFLLNATIGIENRSNNSRQANFEEDSYPISFSAWYAATQRLSLNGGLGFYSNWIDQDIIFGDQTGGYQGPPNPNRFFLSPIVERVNYGARTTVLNVGATYAWTERIRLLGGVEFVRGTNAFESLPLWPEMASLSNVIIETTRITAGVDWKLRERIDAFCRYVYYDWNDESEPFDSGTAHAVLGGLSALF